MGANLYLNSSFKKNYDKYGPKIEHWASRRDALWKAGKEKEANEAQRKMVKYFAKMQEQWYFRDSYNDTSLLWLFDISWWVDVLDVLTDENTNMSPSNAKRFLNILKEHESYFETNLKRVDVTWSGSRAEIEKYFRGKYENLKNLLKEAIDKKEHIECML
ncbi:MAG TPA: hypothetical protein VMW64_03310 [Dehalococcoidia bacterium]|nr:hypothetical protein [Dehalococcoidia bacterium]